MGTVPMKTFVLAFALESRIRWALCIMDAIPTATAAATAAGTFAGERTALWITCEDYRT